MEKNFSPATKTQKPEQAKTYYMTFELLGFGTTEIRFSVDKSSTDTTLMKPFHILTFVETSLAGSGTGANAKRSNCKGLTFKRFCNQEFLFLIQFGVSLQPGINPFRLWLVLPLFRSMTTKVAYFHKRGQGIVCPRNPEE